MNPFDEYRERLVRAKDTNAITWFDQALAQTIIQISKAKMSFKGKMLDSQACYIHGNNDGIDIALESLRLTERPVHHPLKQNTNWDY